MAKDESDIFIYEPQKGDYWAHPTLFVAHGTRPQIRFRNLTALPLEIDLQGTPVHPQKLSLSAGGLGVVTVDDDATAGFHQYKADMLLPPSRRQAVKRATALPAFRRKAVKGGSSPKIIVDT